MSVILNASTSSGFVQTADTSGELNLQSNGTTRFTVASTGAYGQLVSGTAVASTSGTSIDFTSIPSWVKRITVMFSNVGTNGTSVPTLQIGDSGGIENTGYVSSALTAGSTTPATASSTTAFILYGSTWASSVFFNGTLVLTLLGSNTWTGVFNFGRESGSSTCTFGSGVKTLSDVLDRVRITTVNGTDTFDAGTINILYEG